MTSQRDVPPHVDATGAPCTRHPAASAAGLMQLALVGSRAPAFHHDCASKLQGLVMALDELSELTEGGDPQILRALESALEASRELNALLNINRALTKPPGRTDIAVQDLVTRAAQRVAINVQGALPQAMVCVSVPAMTHGLALVLDVAGGAGRGRTLAITGARGAAGVELVLPMSAIAPSSAAEGLALATFVVARDGGRVWCATEGDRLHVQLPSPPAGA
ncbi:MAG: hypothetical protein ABIY55_03855 [Kofleriaceae bacterium]